MAGETHCTRLGDSAGARALTACAASAGKLADGFGGRSSNAVNTRQMLRITR